MAAPVKADASKTMLIDIPPDIMKKINTGKVLPRQKRKVIRGQSRLPGQPAPAGQARSPAQAATVTVQNADLGELFQGVYDAGIITDLKGDIVDANIRATQFFRYTREELCESNVMDLILGFAEKLIQTICENLKNDKFTLIMAQCVRKDGTHFPAEISSSRLKLSAQDYLCFFVRDITARREAEDALLKAHEDLEKEVAERARVNEDLTKEIGERRRAEQELNQAVQRLQEHDRAKSEFVSNVSHELKTPLASILYVASNLLRGVVGEVPEAAKEYLRMVKEDCQRLGRTVEDILDMSRMEANTLALALVKIPFAELVARAAESMKIQAEAEDLTMTCAIGATERFVKCDPQKMERVIFNLVRNAIKFNVKNGIIEVILHDDPKHPHYVTLDVIDSGVGIEEKYLSRVTERFFRVGEHVSGTGLGLSICKDLLERHGGMLELKSPPPGRAKGTQATVRLPVVLPSTVMIIYGDKNLRLDLTRQLVDHGYNVVSNESDESAVGRVRQEGADLVILDWILPGMTGGVMIARIRNEKDLGNLPIVAIAGRDMEPSKKDILDGFDIPHVAWPWNERELLNALYEATISKKRLEKLKK